MSELGARLRQSREAQGISLAQAAVDTRILQQSIIALEEGAYHRLPSDVVIRGFVRNYAQYLDLPADEMIELYRRERGSTDKIRIVPATIPPRSRSYVLPGFFGVFFVTIALVGLAYVGLNAIGRIGDRAAQAPAAITTPTTLPPSPLPIPTDTAVPNVQTGTATDVPGVVLAPTRPPATIAGGSAATVAPSNTTTTAPIVLEVNVPLRSGGENSWIRIEVDGNTAYEGIMTAGEQLTFEAQRRVFIRAGNPPDVFVTVNGLQQGALGQAPGQPVNWSWPPN